MWWVVGGGSWVVGRGWWVKKKLVGRKILSVVKLVGEIWWVVGRVVLSLLAQFLPRLLTIFAKKKGGFIVYSNQSMYPILD